MYKYFQMLSLKQIQFSRDYFVSAIVIHKLNIVKVCKIEPVMTNNIWCLLCVPEVQEVLSLPNASKVFCAHAQIVYHQMI